MTLTPEMRRVARETIAWLDTYPCISDGPDWVEDLPGYDEWLGTDMPNAKWAAQLRALLAVTPDDIAACAVLRCDDPEQPDITIIEPLLPEGARALVGDMVWYWRGRGTLRVLRRLGYYRDGSEDEEVLAERVRLADAAERARRAM